MSPEQYRQMLDKATLSVQRLNRTTPPPAPKAPPVACDHRLNTDESKLNKTELKFLSYLRMLGYGPIYIQAIQFKIGDDCRFTPDFAYVTASARMLFVDVKAAWKGKIHIEDDALVKLKVAARTYTCFNFATAHQHEGEWLIQEIKP